MWKQAIEEALSITSNNIARFGSQFPKISRDGVYVLDANTDWTDGFWTGIVWLCYEYSKDEQYRRAALSAVESFRGRLADDSELRHHDIGFLYVPSCVAHWHMEQDSRSRDIAVEAAERLMRQYRPRAGIIQAWGDEGDPQNGGRIIIDCLMNLSLLYWATAISGDAKYSEAAIRHADQSRRFLLRGDDSSYHTFYFDEATGEPVRGNTHQGLHDGSTWTRGQAWGIYGFALSYRYTGNKLYLESARRLARYFCERLPEDSIVYWDFDVPATADTKKDSSAAAIAASGMLELARHLAADDPERKTMLAAVGKIMRSLVASYSNKAATGAEGLINHGAYIVKADVGADAHTIWGDYFYLEALMKLEIDHRGYW